MSGGTYWRTRVQCPFYQGDDKEVEGYRDMFRVVCEGFVEDSNVIQRYRKKEDRNTQMRIFCAEHYEKCEIYRMLMEAKYDEVQE